MPIMMTHRFGGVRIAHLAVYSKGCVQWDRLFQLEVGLYRREQRRELHFRQLSCALVQQRLYLHHRGSSLCKLDSSLLQSHHTLRNHKAQQYIGLIMVGAPELALTQRENRVGETVLYASQPEQNLLVDAEFCRTARHRVTMKMKR